MREMFALILALAACVVSRGSFAADQPEELALLAGQWQAQSYHRTGQQPADEKTLKALTVEIKGDRWNQKFRGDTAPYQISLEATFTPKMIVLTHLKVNVIRRCTYELKGDLLTVTEEFGEPGDILTIVWKRQPAESK